MVIRTDVCCSDGGSRSGLDDRPVNVSIYSYIQRLLLTTNPFTRTRYATLTLTPSTLGRFVDVVEVAEEEEGGGLLLVCRRFRSPLAADVMRLLIAVASPVVSFGMVVEDRGMGPEANDDSTKRDVHDRIKSGKRHCFMLPTSDRYNAPTNNPHTAGTNVEKYCESIIYHKCNEPYFLLSPTSWFVDCT